MITCTTCNQPLAPGKIPCKAKSLDVQADGRVVLELEATCSECGGPLIVRWFLYCSIMNDRSSCLSPASPIAEGR